MKKYSSRNLALVSLVFLMGGCDINKLPTYDEQVRAAESEILNQYQRRADLIPELVEVVRAASAHEESTLVELAAIRSHLEQIEPRSNEKKHQEIDVALKKILAVSESNPSLQANQHYLALVSELEGTENRIAFARRDYIQTIKIYNTELRTYPGKLIAAILYRDMKLREVDIDATSAL